MVVSQELLLPFKPWVHVLVALEHNRLVESLGEAFEERAQFLPCVLGADTQLEREMLFQSHTWSFTDSTACVID